MSIWQQPFDLRYVNEVSRDSMVGCLGIEFIDVGDDFVTAKMPVNNRTKQPAGVLHGGASVALAETVGTWGATFAVDREKFHCVGMEINANHVRAVSEGTVVATGRPLHIGGKTHVWEIRIQDQDGRLVCVSRLTIAVLQNPSRY